MLVAPTSLAAILNINHPVLFGSLTLASIIFRIPLLNFPASLILQMENEVPLDRFR
jgi:hypothetical protein